MQPQCAWLAGCSGPGTFSAAPCLSWRAGHLHHRPQGAAEPAQEPSTSPATAAWPSSLSFWLGNRYHHDKSALSPGATAEVLQPRCTQMHKAWGTKKRKWRCTSCRRTAKALSSLRKPVDHRPRFLWGDLNVPDIQWQGNAAGCKESRRILEGVEDNS